MYARFEYLTIDNVSSGPGRPKEKAIVARDNFIGNIYSASSYILNKRYGFGVVATHIIRVHNSVINFKPDNKIIGSNGLMYTIKKVESSGTDFILVVEEDSSGVVYNEYLR